MITIKEAIVVEGKYDKIRLSSLVDATIVEAGGFRIYKDKEKMELLRLLAERTGLVVLTDSDASGFKIRRYLNGAIGPQYLKHVYIPDVYGKERRKAQPSAEGKLGVEGMTTQVLLEAFQRAGLCCEEGGPPRGRPITKQDFYLDGLTGGVGSSLRRKALLEMLNLPEHLTTNAMLTLFNTMFTYDEYKGMVDSLLKAEPRP